MRDQPEEEQKAGYEEWYRQTLDVLWKTPHAMAAFRYVRGGVYQTYAGMKDEGHRAILYAHLESLRDILAFPEVYL